MWAIASVAIVLLFGAEASSARTFEQRVDHVTSGSQLESASDGGLGLTDASKARPLSPYSLGLIETFEAWVAHPYNDASMYCTIGYGHLVAKQPCSAVLALLTKFDDPMTLRAGVELLDEDTARARLAVAKLVQVNLNDGQFGALSSFVFNVGAENFRKSSLLSYINEGNFEGASRQFGKWVKSKGKVLNGLVARRACEAALFKGSVPSGPSSTFKRSDCDTLAAAAETEELLDIETGER